MSRTLSATITTAVAQPTTKPVYLVDMGWDVSSPDINRYACTSDANISWNSITWVASGIEINGLDQNGCNMTMPRGDADPWQALVVAQVPRGRAISIYEYQTDMTVSPHTSDAVLLFTGLMDSTSIGRDIRIQVITGVTRKGWPKTTIGPPTYNYLLATGERLQWNYDVVIANG